MTDEPLPARLLDDPATGDALPRNAAHEENPTVAKTDRKDSDELIDAELVPDPPSPLAFGMKAMFGLMAISAVQFALMSYLGPFIGLLAGVGLCVLAMGVLMVTSVILGLKPGQERMEQMDRLAIRMAVGLVVLFFGTILAGGGQMIYMSLDDARFHWRMQSDLGIAYSRKTLYDFEEETNVNVLELTDITIGGPFDQAGVQKGDLILLDTTADDFLQKLDDLRGQSIDIPIANYKASSGASEIDEATKRPVTVHLPE